ncbi:MAG: PAS domain S-box protein, partial [Desulfofustis sp.]|nr:PAS domain S-box protein [Desulfofustis sp.]
MTDKPTRDPEQPKDDSAKREHSAREDSQAASTSCENAFAAFFANSLDALFITCPDGRILRANPAACRMLGYSEEEIITLGRDGILDVNDEHLAQALEERRQKGSYRGEINFIHKSGRVIPTEITTVIFQTVDGEERSSIIVRDLTEKKQKEHQVREQKRLNQTLLDALPCVALLLRPATREIVAMNQAAKRAGCEIGKTCFATWAGFTSPCPWCLAPNVWATGEPQHHEIEGLGVIWDAYWLKVSDDLYIHYAFDVTEHKKHEKALRDHEQFTKTVMDHLPIGLAVNSVDPAVTMIYMNDNFARFYRTTKEALRDPDSFWEAVYEDPDFRREIKERVLEDCASGDPRRMIWEDIPITRKGRQTHYICAQNTPVLNNSMMLSTVWDVTERMRIQIELKKSEEQYRTLFESMDEGFCVIQVVFDETGTAEDYLLLETNPAFSKHTGLVDVRGKLMNDLIAPGDDSWSETFGRIARTGVPERFEKQSEILNRWFEVYAFRISKPREHKVAILLQDISERKRAEADRERLQAQLIQAQKLESVGR